MQKRVKSGLGSPLRKGTRSEPNPQNAEKNGICEAPVPFFNEHLAREPANAPKHGILTLSHRSYSKKKGKVGGGTL